jgi:hypothetical protein
MISACLMPIAPLYRWGTFQQSVGGRERAVPLRMVPSGRRLPAICVVELRAAFGALKSLKIKKAGTLNIPAQFYDLANGAFFSAPNEAKDLARN